MLVSIEDCTARSTKDESILRVPLVSEGVFVNNTTKNIDCVFYGSYRGTGKNWFFEPYGISVLNIRVKNKNRRGGLSRNVWNCDGLWMRPYCDSCLMSNLVGRSFAEVLYLDHSFRLKRILKTQQCFRNTDIGSQVSDLGCFHLGDDSFRLLTCFGHLPFLSLSNVGLFRRYFQGFPQQDYLQEASESQQKSENPSPPVSPVPTIVYRDGGKLADRYGIARILICLFVSIPIRGFGLILADIISACTSGAIGRLPRSWSTCLHDDQEHSENQEFHFQEAVLDQN